jgi:hypothetical protein
LETQKERPDDLKSDHSMGRLEAMVSMVLETARLKGWTAKVDAQDNTSFKYATVSVARHCPGALLETGGATQTS